MQWRKRPAFIWWQQCRHWIWGRVWGFWSRVGYMRFVCFQMWWDLREGWLEEHCQLKISPPERCFLKYAQAGPHKNGGLFKSKQSCFAICVCSELHQRFWLTNKKTSTRYLPVGDHVCLHFWNCCHQVILTRKPNFGLLMLCEVLDIGGPYAKSCIPLYWRGEHLYVLGGHWYVCRGGLDWLPLWEGVAE